MESEFFKDIKGYEGIYQISSYGRVKSMARKFTLIREHPKTGTIFKQPYHKKEIFLKPAVTKHGYLFVALQKRRDIKHNIFIHKLVANTFLPIPAEDGTRWQVNHKDGNKQNNYLSNLEIISDKENMAHAAKTGLLKNRVNTQILSYEDAEQIRKLYSTGSIGQFSLAFLYGCSQPHICNILKYRTWASPTKKIDKTTDEYIARIIERKKQK